MTNYNWKKELKEHLDIIESPDTSVRDTFDSYLLLRMILCAMGIDSKNSDDAVELAKKSWGINSYDIDRVT